jgi:hypothetical protein
MKFSEFFSGQRVIQQVLDWFNLSKNQAITERITDSHTNGVVDTELNNMNIVGKDLDAALTDFFHVKVDTGIAYKNGERIYINPANVTYDATNPTDTTDDGKGNPIATPHSTGSFDIPLTAGFINYLYIAYLQTTDENEFTLHKLTNAKQFYKRTDGYQIVVNTTGVNPNSSLYILLGQVNLTGFNQAIASNIDITARPIYRVKKKRVQIETNNVGLTDRPTTYAVGQQILSLDDHIKSVGTGTISPFNPHGTSAADLGLEENELVRSHRLNEHAPGLIAGTPGNPTPSLSAMFVERIIVGLGDDFLRIKPLISGEYLIVNGLAFDSIDFPVEVIVNFLTGTDAAGTYEIYFDTLTETIGKQIGGIVGDPTKFRLASIAWDNAGNLGPPTERRRFGTMNQLQRWTVSGRPENPMPGTFGFNLDTSLPEYYNGTTWVNL